MQQPAVFKGTEHCLLFVMGIKFMHRPASANRATWPFVWPSYQGQTFMHSYTLIFSLHNWKVEGKWSITTGRRDSLQHIHTHTVILTGSSNASPVTVVVRRRCLSVLKQFAKGFTLPFTAHLASAHLQWKGNMKHAVRNDTCITTLCTHGPYALRYARTYTNKHKVTPAM